MTRQISKMAAGLVVAVALSVPGFTAAAADPALARGGKVTVIPFSTLNVPTDQQWIGKGLQESLIADLGPEYSPVAFSGQTIVEDNATAARVARDAGVPYAVRGVAQVINGEVRLTAQIIDAKTGDTVTTANVTGQLKNLLRLEDEVGAQLRGVASPLALTPPAPPIAPLPPATTSRQITTYTMPSAPPTYQQPQPYPPAPFNDISLSAQNYNNYYPAYSYYPVETYYPVNYGSYYCAPSYPSYYPAFGSVSIGFGGRNLGLRGGFRDGFHGGFHGGFGGGGFHNGFGGGGFHGGFGGSHFGGGHGGRR